MITIFAEKPDVGNKIAAALDCITLDSGKKIYFKDLKTNEKAVKAQQAKNGYLRINFKGEECYVTWGYGHLCELKGAADYNSDYKNWSKMPMPFFPEKYDVKVKPTVKKQFDIVKGLMNKSSLVINATDYDREGELIFYYTYEAAKCKKPFKRAYFSSQTQEALVDSFDHLKNSNDVVDMTNAGIARSIADAAVGWNLTAQLTLKTKSRTPLSVGRVQTPTLNILVKREKEIQNFKPEPYYVINALFKTSRGEEYKGTHKTKRFDKKEDAEDIMKQINGHQGTVLDIKKKTVKEEVPNLFSLSTLQMTASEKYGFTLSKTLQLAQSLYDSGFTTYPRTDSQYLTEDMEPVVNTVLDMLEKNPDYSKYISGRARKFDKPRFFDDKKVVSHFAIIPTKTPASGLTADQSKLYDLIAKSVIMMLYGPAEIEKTSVTTDVNNNEFLSHGSVIVNPGWMEVDKRSKDEILPSLSLNEKVNGTYSMDSKMTQPPKRYTDKTLLSAMIAAGKDLDDEELKKVMARKAGANGEGGLGTPATRAAIVENIINRGYAERNKKNICATAKGIALIDMLPIEEIKSAELTARWESRLDDISVGKESLKTFVDDIEAQTKKWVDELGTKIQGTGQTMSFNEIGVCPKCGGKIIKTKWGYGCSEWKNGCKFTISGEIGGNPKKKITETMVKQLLTNRITNSYQFMSKEGKPFLAKLKLNPETYKVEFEYVNTGKKKTK